MRAGKLALIYIVALGFAAFFNFQFPSQAAAFVDFFFPTTINLASEDFIRYRMVLFLTATIVLLILVPLIAYFGMREFNREKFQHTHWSHFVIAVLAVPIGWIVYPFIALCAACWTGNDFFYFFLTVGCFVGFQIFIQAIVLKLKLMKGI
ncbi:hypothetical protein [Polaromonas sp. YR568]|uniref:hypothetical protein n=1 Tax=Polaromonas sp. YR568 TaxID=1855301 RepID=UPI00398BEBCB